MLYGTYLSASGMALNQAQQDVLANNLANVDTAGFKRDLAVFQERLQAGKQGGNFGFIPENLKRSTGGAFISTVQTDFSDGSLVQTDNNLDLAIKGPGFLTIQDGDKVRYTRDGRLAVADGRLVTEIGGKPVLDDRGQEIDVLDFSSKELRIDSQGNLWAKNQQLANLGIVEFDQPQNIKKIGGNLFDAAGEEPRSVETQVVSGAVEASTVSPTTEMVDMIKASRSYQINAQMISLQDQTLGRLMSEMPRL
jgi:flagellar basal-body rod protein FlgF